MPLAIKGENIVNSADGKKYAVRTTNAVKILTILGTRPGFMKNAPGMAACRAPLAWGVPAASRNVVRLRQELSVAIRDSFLYGGRVRTVVESPWSRVRWRVPSEDLRMVGPPSSWCQHRHREASDG